jgi:hypothetical protein
MRTALDVLDRHAHPKAVSAAWNLSEDLIGVGRLDDAADAAAASVGWARRLGSPLTDAISQFITAKVAYHRGDPASALAAVDAAARLSDDAFTATNTGALRARLTLEHDPRGALAATNQILDYAQTTDNDEHRLDALALRAKAYAVLGEDAAAGDALDAFLGAWDRTPLGYMAPALAEIAVQLAAQDRHDDVGRALRALGPTPWREALTHVAAGRYVEAADVFAAMPSVPLRDAVRALDVARA